MDNNQNIIWKKEYDTGIVLIDKQHRKLVEIINQLNEAKNQNKAKEVLRDTIIKLVDYTKYHFDYEEKHMMQNVFENYEEHKKQHGQFIQKVIEIINNLNTENLELLTNNLLEFLKDWIVNHILEEDKKYGTYYINRQKNSV